MRTKIHFVLFCFLVVSPVVHGEEQTLMKREEVVRLFGRSVEMNSPKERENFRILQDAGERAYPALAEVLLSDSDPDAISNVVPIFLQSKGDKTIPLRAMMEFVELHINDDPINQEINSVIRGIGALGGAKEAEFLKGLPQPTEVLVQHVIEDNYEKIEKRLVAEDRRLKSIERRVRRGVEDSLGGPAILSEAKSKESSSSTTPQFKWQLLVGAIAVFIVCLFYLLRKRIA